MDGVAEPGSPTQPTGHQHQSGHSMCYEGRTSSRALDSGRRAPAWRATHGSPEWWTCSPRPPSRAAPNLPIRLPRNDFPRVKGRRDMALDPVDVIRRFEPILYFHRDETLFPSDAKRYLERCALWDVNGGPRDDRARWGGASPRTFPHFPRIPRGKLIAAEGEDPVVGESGLFIGQPGL